MKGCFCPHCGGRPAGQGYDWLATSTIVPALTKLLPKVDRARSLLGPGSLVEPSSSPAPSTCTLTSATGTKIDLTSLNRPEGNMVVTPLGNMLVNPCTKVTVCDAMQPESACCVQVNDTAHPGTARWVSCGTTPTAVTLGGDSAPPLFEPSLFCNLNLTWHTALVCGHPHFDQVSGSSMGIVLKGGPNCGYVFAPNQRVQASISFICDPAAGGYGRVTASGTFMGQHCAGGGVPSSGGTYRCINDQCVASTPGLPGYNNVTCTQGCGKLAGKHFN